MSPRNLLFRLASVPQFIFAFLLFVIFTKVYAEPIVHTCGPESWTNLNVRYFRDIEMSEIGILNWRIVEDDRPLYVEKAIIAVRGESQWHLASIFRHPKDTSDPTWDFSYVDDAPQTPLRNYQEPPTENEIQQFYETSWWNYSPPRTGFRTLGEGECKPWWHI